MTIDMYELFAEEFPKAVEQQVRKSGTLLTYIPVSEVINRLNRVVGVNRWSQEILSVGRDSHDPDYVTAHVRVTVNIGDSVISRDGVGGQKIKRMKSGDIVDLGDEYKGAVSDAFKKACQTLGIGLYLARSEEALAADVEYVSVDDGSDDAFRDLKAVTATMSSDQKAKLRAFWASSFGDVQVGAAAGTERLRKAIDAAKQILEKVPDAVADDEESRLLSAFPGSEVIEE